MTCSYGCFSPHYDGTRLARVTRNCNHDCQCPCHAKPTDADAILQYLNATIRNLKGTTQ